MERKRDIGHRMDKDPVCGMDVDLNATAFKKEHDGETYGFCSERCLKQFEVDPANYISPEA
jgi:Cu+-exporting ATPase